VPKGGAGHEKVIQNGVKKVQKAIKKTIPKSIVFWEAPGTQFDPTLSTTISTFGGGLGAKMVPKAIKKHINKSVFFRWLRVTIFPSCWFQNGVKLAPISSQKLFLEEKAALAADIRICISKTRFWRFGASILETKATTNQTKNEG
jgi:hypothetical protein